MGVDASRRLLAGAVGITGEATRTPELRIMRPQPIEHKTKFIKGVAMHRASVVAAERLDHPNDSREQAEAVIARPCMSEANRASIVLLARPDSKDGETGRRARSGAIGAAKI